MGCILQMSLTPCHTRGRTALLGIEMLFPGGGEFEYNAQYLPNLPTGCVFLRLLRNDNNIIVPFYLY